MMGQGRMCAPASRVKALDEFFDFQVLQAGGRLLLQTGSATATTRSPHASCHGSTGPRNLDLVPTHRDRAL